MLCQQGAVHCLSNVMRNSAPGGCWYQQESGSSKTAQMLVQVTAALRNLSLQKKHWKQFWAAKVVEGLCLLVMAYDTHEELCLNISRILGKLTINEKARAVINSDKQTLPNLLHLLKPRPKAKRAAGMGMGGAKRIAGGGSSSSGALATGGGGG